MQNPGTHATPPEWFYSLRQFSANHHIDIGQACLVWRVAPHSPADALGLGPGDALISVNGVRVSGLDIDELLLSGQDMFYRFYLVRKRIILEISMPPIPLGIRLLESRERLVETYRKNGFYGAEGIMSLWEREDYEGLLEIARCLETKPKISLLPKWLERTGRDPLAGVLEEICAFETRDGQDDLARLQSFVKEDIEDYPAEIQALAWYYLSCKARQNADVMYTQEYMQIAYGLYPDSGRLARAAENVGVKTHSLHPMLGRLIPDHYRLKTLKDNGSWAEETSLPELAETMQAGQLMPICFLPDTRDNLAYNQALRVYRTMIDQMGTRLAPMLVLCNRAAETKLTDAEKDVRADGLPLTIALEESGNFVRDLDIHQSPTFWAINKSLRVVWTDGLVDACDYWSLLASVEGSTGALYEGGEGTGAFGVGEVF